MGYPRKGDIKSPRIRQRQLERMYKKYEGICQVCFKETPREQATRGHIIACGDGGSYTDDNIRLECNACNSKDAKERNNNRWKGRAIEPSGQVALQNLKRKLQNT